jgi:hypothetical protein
VSPYRRGGELRPTAPRVPGRRRGNRIYYVVAEGEGTEYDYLGHLNASYGSDLGFIIRWRNQRRGLQTPSNRDPSTDLYLLVEDLGIVPRPR